MLWALVPPARWFSPVRLLIAATLLAVAGTAALTVRLTRRGSLTGDILAARAIWTRHIEAGDFVKARAVLDQAVAEIKRYGKKSRETREVEQLAREVALFAEWPERPLEDLLMDISSVPPNEAIEHFRTKFNNPSLIFDVYVSPSAADPNTFRVDSNVWIGSHAVRLDLSGFGLLKLLAPGPSTRVLFGARIHSAERTPESNDWIVRFLPDSGSLITSELCLENIGWPVDEATRTLLERQAKWILDQP
jgi:hypothetical protein